MATTSSKSITQQDWYNDGGWRWGWNTANEAYAGHTSSNGYYTTKMQFTTPAFTGVSTSITFTFKVKLVYASSPSYRIAICTSTSNQLSYCDTSSAVTDSYQIVSTYGSFSGLTSSYQSKSVTISTNKLKPSTTYYVFIWTYATSNSAMFNTATTHTFYITYTQGAVRIDTGSEWITAIPYIDTGSEWVMAIPYIDDGSSWHIAT